MEVRKNISDDNKEIQYSFIFPTTDPNYEEPKEKTYFWLNVKKSNLCADEKDKRVMDECQNWNKRIKDLGNGTSLYYQYGLTQEGVSDAGKYIKKIDPEFPEGSEEPIYDWIKTHIEFTK